MIYALKAGYGRKGARIGSRDGEAELFKADMLAFWRRTLGVSGELRHANSRHHPRMRIIHIQRRR